MFPRRIVCLTEETTETLYLLGEGDARGRDLRLHRAPGRGPRQAQGVVVPACALRQDRGARTGSDPGVLGSAGRHHDRARQARLSRCSRSTSAAWPRSCRWSGCSAASSACPTRAAALVAGFERGLDAIRASAARFPARPRVYFEEWDEPLISGIRWVEELVEIAGGTPDLSGVAQRGARASDRIVTAERVIAAAPDVFIGSWCGKPVKKDKVRRREGWERRALHRARPPLRSEVDLHPAARTGRPHRGRAPASRGAVPRGRRRAGRRSSDRTNGGTTGWPSRPAARSAPSRP